MIVRKSYTFNQLDRMSEESLARALREAGMDVVYVAPSDNGSSLYVSPFERTIRAQSGRFSWTDNGFTRHFQWDDEIENTQYYDQNVRRNAVEQRRLSSLILRNTSSVVGGRANPRTGLPNQQQAQTEVEHVEIEVEEPKHRVVRFEE